MRPESASAGVPVITLPSAGARHSPGDLAAQLEQNARALGGKAAIVYPDGKERDGSTRYRELSYRDLQARVERAADGLCAIGVGRGTRTVLLASGPDLFVIAFALFRLGAIPVVVDPGIGIRRVLHCYRTAQATAFVGPPAAHVMRLLGAGAFRRIRIRVTIGRRWFWGGHTLARLPGPEGPGREPGAERSGPPDRDALAMIAFTTGSTGPPKGVEYTHRAIDAMAGQVRDSFGHAEGDVSLVTVAPHGVFDLLAGSTMVLAPVRPGRVADADPAAVTEALARFGVSVMFASPALLQVLADYLATRPVRLPRLRSIVSGGASVSPALVSRLRTVLDERALIHVTYGATEALLICSIESAQLLAETGRESQGAGSCVGRPVTGTEVRIIAIRDRPLSGDRDEARALPAGRIGEVLVAGELVSQRYYADAAANAFHKVSVTGSGPGNWHRTGDLGYFDQSGRLFLCGRMTQRVRTPSGDLYPLPCEAVFDAHPLVRRSALVAVHGDGRYQTPVVCVETHTPLRSRQWDQLVAELRALAEAEPATAQLRLFLQHPAFPVDARHNAKIKREVLASWAEGRISAGRRISSAGRRGGRAVRS
jgi:acyl-CoA synthetase (AMP-forming)/AMP-acid ligase II